MIYFWGAKNYELELLEHVTFDIDDSFMLDLYFFTLGKLKFTVPLLFREEREKRKNGELKLENRKITKKIIRTTNQPTTNQNRSVWPCHRQQV